MRFIKTICCYSLLLILFACEKVIDIKVRESDRRYVIEGIVTDEPGSCKVYLSQTKPFNEDNNFAQVSGAIIQVKDNDIEHSLIETRPGVYENSTVRGVPGHVYQLSVTINNQVFSASCTMPERVALDTLYISRGPFGQFNFATIKYTDPAGTNNRYRFVQYVNGVKDPEIFWENDEFTDGEEGLLQLDTGIDKKDDPRNINSGNEVTIEMHSLDEKIYKYWYSVSIAADGSGNTAAPANPITNIVGGALGYFSAHTVDRKMVIAP